jgi:alginate O-acetyltransferase complex protein AlgI
MLFTSGLFLFLFLPVTVIGFFVIARFARPAFAASWLFAMSLLFYGFWVPALLGLLVGSILFNFFGGIWIARHACSKTGKAITTLWIAANLILLAFFKYYNFFIDNLAAAGVHLPVLNVVLPIGISFFTFTQIAFLADAYKGKVRDARLVHYGLFVTYFPHLIAGPILHHSEMMPQFAEPRTYRPDLVKFALGAAFLLVGLAKKILVADSVSGIADHAFNAAAHGQVGPLHAWEGAIAYAMQIYFDFSGYSDMAIGISLLLNIQLPFNFASPYRATNIIEFWRRWHMTLSRFLRDYLYIGLGGNRHGQVRRYINLAATMVLGGLWHGAAWTFVIWGALHGAYLIINHGWHWLRERLGLSLIGGTPARALGWAITMLGIVIAWVFFRATTIDGALAMLHAMAGATPQVDQLAGREQAWLLLTALTAFVVLLPNSQTLILDRLKPLIERRASAAAWPIWAGLGAWSMAVCWLALVAASRENSAFIYFNF